MKSIGLIVALLGLAGTAFAVQQNLDSHGVGDSLNTAGAFAFRDSAGNIDFGSDTTANSFHMPNVSSTTLLAYTPRRIGDLYAIIDAAGKFAITCVSTGTALGQVAMSTNTASACGRN